MKNILVFGLLIWLMVAQVVLLILWRICIIKNARQDIIRKLSFIDSLMVICTTLDTFMPGKIARAHRKLIGLQPGYKLRYIPYILVVIIVYPALITTSFIYTFGTNCVAGFKNGYNKSRHK